MKLIQKRKIKAKFHQTLDIARMMIDLNKFHLRGTT